MSVQAMSWVFDESEATLGDRLVLLAVANHADAHGRNSWASTATLAIEAKLSSRQVQRCLRNLEASGDLARVGKRGFRSDRLTNVYEMPKLAKRHDKMSPRETERGDISGTDGVTPVSPKPSSNHPINKEKVIGSQTSRFIGLWCTEYLSKFGRRYAAVTPRDAAAAKRFFEGNDHVNAEEVVRVARAAWELGNPNTHWNCSRSRAIAAFLNSYNEVLSEIGSPVADAEKYGAPGPRDFEGRPL